jgi:DNA-binding ferritin-like protein
MDLIRYQSQPEGSAKLTQKLDGLLTDYELYHRNLRRIHWDQKLRPFLDFNEKLTRLYHIADNSKHEIAENLLSLGGEPDLKNMEVAHLLPHTHVNALSEVRDFDHATRTVVQNSYELLQVVRDVMLLAAELREGNTQKLMAGLAHQLTFTIAIFNGVRLAQLN